MARTVIVGDVHGCTGELEDLLERSRFDEGTDRLVLVGDLVVARPRLARACSRWSRASGARSARGNHEEKLLAWRRRGKPLGPDHERVAKELSDERVAACSSAMPLWIDLPEHGARVVHAGVVPGVRDRPQRPPDALLKMRTIDARGRWSDEADAGPLWGTKYAGPPHVVFGHNARARAAAPPVGDGPRHGLRLRRPADGDGARRGRAGARAATACSAC